MPYFSALTRSFSLSDPGEKPLEAQSKWKGDGRFILKKVTDDPSTRAWMSTIRSICSRKEKQKKRRGSGTVSLDVVESLKTSNWNEDEEPIETFLVCVYNVSHNQPYTILKAPTTSTTQDIIALALHKARRKEEPSEFVIVEEEEHHSETCDCKSSRGHHTNSCKRWRCLDEDENVYAAQSMWKERAHFVLKKKEELAKADISGKAESKLFEAFKMKNVKEKYFSSL